MKLFTVGAFVVLALLALGSSKDLPSKFADQDFLIKQKFILEIFQHIYQDDVFITKYDAKFYDYKPWEHMDDYNHHENLHDFFELWQHKPMTDDEIFTVMYDRHEEYVIGLERLFYYAKDWSAFQHAVFWARMHVNKQLFIYALTSVSLARTDLEGIVLPAIYEIHPWHFFDAETIEQAEFQKMHGFHKANKLNNVYNVAIKTNYSNTFGNINYEHNLAYFLEDVGMNSFYYYYHLDYPFWAHGRDDKKLDNDRRGELYIFMHLQLLARYYMERLSNDLGEADAINMYEANPTGHADNLNYYRGIAFPGRENYHNFYHDENIELLDTMGIFSTRLLEWITKNEDYTTVAINKLGNMLQGNVDSIDQGYYGSLDHLYRLFLNEARPYGKYQELLPTVFMHYETSMRDPLFYEMYREITGYYWFLMGQFPAYTKKDYEFEGVKIENVHMAKELYTYFEYFDADISNAVAVEPAPETGLDSLTTFGRNSHYEGNSFVIKARQYRLNHKPFDFTLDVTSDKAQKAVVKIFMGPKYNGKGHQINLEQNYFNFFLLDNFLVDLVAGTNNIKRSTMDFTWWVNDRTTYFELYQKVMDATKTDFKFKLDMSEAHCGVPRRMMLPKGKPGGMPVQFFFMVYPYHKPAVEQYTGYDPIVSCGVTSGARYVDAMPFGFPFDRPIQHDYYFDVDNFKFLDVNIFHKEEPTNVV